MLKSVLKIGNNAPEFCLPDKDNKEVCLKDFRGKFVVLYFYPKDNTPGCITEAIGFTTILPDFQKLDAEIIGISADSPESHAKFAENKYGAWGKKKFRGKEYMGVIRSTYLIDPNGKIVYIWPKVSPKGHAEEVKSILEEKVSK
ncbi:MAG: peroxiredoxin [Candidatus Lokiarchaeota archaeon]